MRYTIFVFVLVLLSLSFAHGADATRYTFGYSGQNGYSGNSGRDGYDGTKQTVFAGSQKHIQAYGSDGEDAYNGQHGESAQNCYQPHNVAYNVEGAHGGNGGSGGRGGNGGSGGDVTVYYEDAASLKQIYINAGAGRGGRGGYAGSGGGGCWCSQHSWQVNGVTYTCQNGYNGSNGYHGSDGSNGSSGSLIAIPQMTVLAPVSPSLNAYFTTIVATSPMLSNHRWATLTGARALLASGSQVQDRYRLYQGRIESIFRVDWQSERPVQDFANVSSLLTLENERAKISLPEDVWMNATHVPDGANTIYQVQGGLYKNEVIKFTLSSITGSGSGLEVAFTDQSGYPQWIDTKLHVRYSTKGGLFYKERFDAGVSANLITKKGDQFILSLGKLPINAEYFTPGTKMRVEIWAKRQYAGRSLTMEYERRKTIGN